MQPAHDATTEPVQPRGCGELHGPVPDGHVVIGSAPRVRGTHIRTRREHASRRFSPAGAGNSVIHPPHLRVPTVQPRGCGELEEKTLAALQLQRFSPAGAGNSHRQ